jgi:hypothetical protein
MRTFQGSSNTITIQKIKDRGIDVLDFTFPLHNTIPKAEFKRRFEEYFMFHEIGFPTVARFKHALKVELEMIMPIYNQIFESQLLDVRILNNYELEETFEGKVGKEIDRNATGTSEAESSSRGSSSSSNSGENRRLYKDTPKTTTNINSMDIVNNITKDLISGTSSNTGSSTDTGSQTFSQNGSETSDEANEYIKRITGNIGVATDSDALANYWKNLKNTWQDLFNELECLFMGTIEMEEDNDLW